MLYFGTIKTITHWLHNCKKLYFDLMKRRFQLISEIVPDIKTTSLHHRFSDQVWKEVLKNSLSIFIQGVPIKSVTTFISSSIHAAFFHEHIKWSILAQTSNIENSWSWDFQNVVYHFCIFKIYGDIAKFVQISIYLINQNCLNI